MEVVKVTRTKKNIEKRSALVNFRVTSGDATVLLRLRFFRKGCANTHRFNHSMFQCVRRRLSSLDAVVGGSKTEARFAVPPHTCCVDFPGPTVWFLRLPPSLETAWTLSSVGSSLDTWPCTKTLSQPFDVRPAKSQRGHDDFVLKVTNQALNVWTSLEHRRVPLGFQGTRCSCCTVSRLGEPLIIRQQHRRAEERPQSRSTPEPVLQNWMHRRALPHSVCVCVYVTILFNIGAASVHKRRTSRLRSHLGRPG